jgi:hypothetical protein
MDEDLEGYWVCSKYDPQYKTWAVVAVLENINNCFGDELYEALYEKEILEDLDDYEYEGSSDFVAIMGKTENDSDFKLEFIEK